MKRFFAIAALLLFIGAPLAQADGPKHDRGSTTSVPPGDILD
jgi:hypothetical protein